MTETTIKLNFSLLEGLEPGTDEFGQANLKMMMDFALQTVDEITWLAAIANDKGQFDTPVVSYEGMVKHIASELYDQSVQHAELWSETYETIYPEVAKFWIQNNRSAYVTSDGGLWVDMDELKADMAKEAANA